jgi:hypothetical protein
MDQRQCPCEADAEIDYEIFSQGRVTGRDVVTFDPPVDLHGVRCVLGGQAYVDRLENMIGAWISAFQHGPKSVEYLGCIEEVLAIRLVLEMPDPIRPVLKPSDLRLPSCVDGFGPLRHLDPTLCATEQRISKRFVQALRRSRRYTAEPSF